MIVEKLIEKLSEMDPSANVVLEGETDDVCFCVREAIDDDRGAFVLLTRGKSIPVIDEDAPPTDTSSPGQESK